MVLKANINFMATMDQAFGFPGGKVISRFGFKGIIVNR